MENEEAITYWEQLRKTFSESRDHTTNELAKEHLQASIDAIDVALAAIKGHGNEPLTLKQLREMDGKPVWVKVIDHTVFADKEDDFDGWGMCRKTWVRVWDGKRADLVCVDYDFEDYGTVWLAYAYPPAHIDREVWTAEWKEYTGADAGFHYCSKCGQQAFNYENGGEVVEVLSEFCPSCGKAMTPEARAELEKRMGVRV